MPTRTGSFRLRHNAAVGNHHWLVRPIVVGGRLDARHRAHDLDAGHALAEDHVFAVEMRRRLEADEELGVRGQQERERERALSKR